MVVLSILKRLEKHMNNLIRYNNGEIELTVAFEKDTIWLSQLQISELFDTTTDNVSLHLKNIYKEKELDENVTTEDFSVVRQDINSLEIIKKTKRLK